MTDEKRCSFCGRTYFIEQFKKKYFNGCCSKKCASQRQEELIQKDMEDFCNFCEEMDKVEEEMKNEKIS